jgi:AAA domain
VVWGAPKSGKTTAACDAPGVQLLFNCEQEDSTRFAHKRDKDKRLIEPIIPPFESGKRSLYDLMGEIAIGARDKSWDGVILDSAAELYRRLLEEISNKAKRPSFEHRQDATSEFERWLRYMVAAPVNFTIIAHAMRVEGDDNTSIQVPLISSKSGSESGIGPKLGGIVGLIAYVRTIETEGGRQRVAQVRSDDMDLGGRFPELETDEGYRTLDIPEWYKLAGIKLNGVQETASAVAP